jgi:hypothetical protein
LSILLSKKRTATPPRVGSPATMFPITTPKGNDHHRIDESRKCILQQVYYNTKNMICKYDKLNNFLSVILDKKQKE